MFFFPPLSLSLFVNLHLTLNKANPKQITVARFCSISSVCSQVWRRAGRPWWQWWQEMPGWPAEVHVAR